MNDGPRSGYDCGKWWRKGINGRSRRGSGPALIPAVIKWHVAGATFSLVGKVEGATTLNLEHERARQAKASADKLEMENAERRRETAPVDQMTLVWGALLGNLKNRLLGMGAKSAKP